MTQRQDAETLFAQAAACSRQGDTEAELRIYDTIVRHYAGDGPAVHHALKALVNKGVVLAGCGRTQDALAAFDEVACRAADAPDPACMERAAIALVNKAVVLSQQRETAAALDAYAAVVTRYGGVGLPGVAAQVAKAQFNRGVSYHF